MTTTALNNSVTVKADGKKGSAPRTLKEQVQQVTETKTAGIISQASVDHLTPAHTALRKRNAAMQNLSGKLSLFSLAEYTLEDAVEMTAKLAAVTARASNRSLSDVQRKGLDREYKKLKKEMEKLLREAHSDSKPGSNGQEEAKSLIEGVLVQQDVLDLPDGIGSVEEAEESFNKVAEALKKLKDEQGEVKEALERIEKATKGLGADKKERQEGWIEDEQQAEEKAEHITIYLAEDSTTGLAAHRQVPPATAYELL